MIALFRSLHAIAARRGDGLRPELLEIVKTSPSWSPADRLAQTDVPDNAGPGSSEPHQDSMSLKETNPHSPSTR